MSNTKRTMDKQTTDLVLIDIGGTSIKYGHFVPENLTITDKGSIPTPKGADNILIAIGQIVADILAKYPLTDAVAISSAGIIDSENGVVYEANEDLMPGYTGTAIAAYIQTNYGLSCHVENDVNCAALAEYYQGAAKGSSSCLMLTIGTGIGGAFIYDGKLLKGHTFSACEVGYMHMKESSFEELGATSVLVKKTAKALGVEDETLDGKKIFDMALGGNEICIRCIDEMCAVLAEGIANICYVLNPEVVVLGGGISARSDVLMPKINDNLKKLLIPKIYEKTSLQFAKNKNDAGMLGAYYAWKNNF